MTWWVYVTMPWATFAMAVRGGIVVEAAPIMRRRAMGKQFRSPAVEGWLRGQGARFLWCR